MQESEGCALRGPTSSSGGGLHMWIPLLNHYRSYRQISTIDEIDCPNHKRFNSPFTQNLFLIMERIFSNNWCLDATFSNWPQVSLMLKKKSILKTNKSKSDFQLWTETPRTPRKKTLDIENSWGYPPPPKSGRGRGGSVLIFLLFFFFQNSWSCPRAYRGAGHRWKSPLDGATDFLWKIWQPITTVSFVSAFILVFALYMSKWGLKIILFMYAGFFLYRAGLVLTRWMLKKDIIVTPTLQRGKN